MTIDVTIRPAVLPFRVSRVDDKQYIRLESKTKVGRYHKRGFARIPSSTSRLIILRASSLLTGRRLKLISTKMFQFRDNLNILVGFLLLALPFYGSISLLRWRSEFKAPTVGVSSRLEAKFISNYRFYREAEAILADGYRRVNPLRLVQSSY